MYATFPPQSSFPLSKPEMLLILLVFPLLSLLIAEFLGVNVLGSDVFR